MHELSLADSMVKEVENYLKKEENEAKVVSIIVEIGRLSGVQKEAFEFAFPIAAEGSSLEESKLVIEEKPAIVKCNECSSETTLDIPIAKCGNCGSRSVKYISGKEFLIKSLEIE